MIIIFLDNERDVVTKSYINSLVKHLKGKNSCSKGNRINDLEGSFVNIIDSMPYHTY